MACHKVMGGSSSSCAVPDLAVGPAVNAASRDRRCSWAADRGAKVSYDTVGFFNDLEELDEDDATGGTDEGLKSADAVAAAIAVCLGHLATMVKY